MPIFAAPVLALLLLRPAPDQQALQARRFAQAFYDRYMRHAQNEPWIKTLRRESASFSPELRRALMEDAQAQARVKNEIVGLDFDPFLNSQDPEPRYTVGPAERRGRAFRMDVYAQSSPKSRALTAVIEKAGGRWRFANFVYDKGENLLGILRQLKRDRAKGGHG